MRSIKIPTLFSSDTQINSESREPIFKKIFHLSSATLSLIDLGFILTGENGTVRYIV